MKKKKIEFIVPRAAGQDSKPPPLKRVCSLISYRLVSAMRHMVDQSLPELLAYGAKLCIELLLFRTYIQLYTHIYTYQYRYIQIYMYAVGSRCC